MHRFALFSGLLVACASTQPGHDAACRDVGTLTPTRVENMLAMTDSLCAGELGEDGRDVLNQPPVRGYMCVEIADAYATGRCGMPRDATRATRYYERACSRGYQVACRAASR
jgi:TPR repeat protein